MACAKCHKPAVAGDPLGRAPFRGLEFVECVDCHKDPHQGHFERACSKWHATPHGWSLKQLQFAHDRDTKFPLTGKHISVECIKCHKPPVTGGLLASAPFKGLAAGCETCHKVKHPETYGPACLSCHTTGSWIKKDPGVGHILKARASGENLTYKHLTAAKCSQCHDLAKIPALGVASRPGFDCSNCHHQEDPHKGTLGVNCAKCHNMEGWKGENLLFKHDYMTSYVLDQDHKKVACAKCHRDNRWKPTSRECADCHPKLYRKTNP